MHGYGIIINFTRVKAGVRPKYSSNGYSYSDTYQVYSRLTSVISSENIPQIVLVGIH